MLIFCKNSVEDGIIGRADFGMWLSSAGTFLRVVSMVSVPWGIGAALRSGYG